MEKNAPQDFDKEEENLFHVRYLTSFLLMYWHAAEKTLILHNYPKQPVISLQGDFFFFLMCVSVKSLLLRRARSHTHEAQGTKWVDYF